MNAIYCEIYFHNIIIFPYNEQNCIAWDSNAEYSVFKTNGNIEHHLCTDGFNINTIRKCFCF